MTQNTQNSSENISKITGNYLSSQRTSYDTDSLNAPAYEGEKDPNLVNNGRFYALYNISENSSEKEPIPVMGWIDFYNSSLSKQDFKNKNLFPLCASDWDWRDVQNSAIKNGKIVRYDLHNSQLKTNNIPLKTSAQKQLNKTSNYLYQTYGMLNEPTPTNWVDYIKKLQTIANGSDTTSTTLPTPPPQ